jgi:hypothetical protein
MSEKTEGNNTERIERQKLFNQIVPLLDRVKSLAALAEEHAKNGQPLIPTETWRAFFRNRDNLEKYLELVSSRDFLLPEAARKIKKYIIDSERMISVWEKVYLQ